MRRITVLALFVCFSFQYCTEPSKITLVENQEGTRMKVNGEDFIINGMNWDYFPIGTNYDYNLWLQPEATIQAALDYEMGMLKAIGVNAIRVYTGIPPRWITYIHDNFGIYTMLNHSFGRYGLTIDGEWVAHTDYADPATQELILAEVVDMTTAYKDTRGLLLFLLGNENNYGLFWSGSETEDIPEEEEEIQNVGQARARPMYKLMNDAAVKMKALGASVPIAICNGDLLYLEIIAEECPDVDIFGTNIYRGISFDDTFERVKNDYGKPVLFTEFGADAYDAIKQEEDQVSQAHYLVYNWEEIYENAAGRGKVGNALGGFTFQFSDGWWKYGQTTNLDVHDTHASWANGGYGFDYRAGENNMNEEWFGICAKGPVKENGVYELYPRLAYHVLKDVHQFNPYDDDTSAETLGRHFDEIKLSNGVKAISTEK